ncbi:hypothetical protein ACFYU9_25750 [Streptomyces sp. NPDC004327]|uniref:hypothetical protein n=1 Tax=Streptomyces sp. NPDC004327 TaxID=3364699 RepID=UPI0036995D4A
MTAEQISVGAVPRLDIDLLHGMDRRDADAPGLPLQAPDAGPIVLDRLPVRRGPDPSFRVYELTGVPVAPR